MSERPRTRYVLVRVRVLDKAQEFVGQYRGYGPKQSKGHYFLTDEPITRDPEKKWIHMVLRMPPRVRLTGSETEKAQKALRLGVPMALTQVIFASHVEIYLLHRYRANLRWAIQDTIRDLSSTLISPRDGQRRLAQALEDDDELPGHRERMEAACWTHKTDLADELPDPDDSQV